MGGNKTLTRQNAYTRPSRISRQPPCRWIGPRVCCTCIPLCPSCPLLCTRSYGKWLRSSWFYHGGPEEREFLWSCSSLWTCSVATRTRWSPQAGQVSDSVYPDLRELWLAAWRLSGALHGWGISLEAAATISVAIKPSTGNLYHAKWWSFYLVVSSMGKTSPSPFYQNGAELSSAFAACGLNIPLFLAISPPLVHPRTRLMKCLWVIILWWLHLDRSQNLPWWSLVPPWKL